MSRARVLRDRDGLQICLADRVARVNDNTGVEIARGVVTVVESVTKCRVRWDRDRKDELEFGGEIVVVCDA